MSENIRFIISPPSGQEFRVCVLCNNPFVWDEQCKLDNCLWCEIHKEDVRKEKYE